MGKHCEINVGVGVGGAVDDGGGGKIIKRPSGNQ